MMGGWKTWAAAAALGIPAIIQLVVIGVDCLVSGGVCTLTLVEPNLKQLAIALGMIGIGHKIEKNGVTL